LSLLVSLLLLWTLATRHSGKVPDSLVVLRFVSQDLSEEDRNFSEGFAQELTSRFNQFNRIHVARAPVDQFSGTFGEVVRAANTLHAIAVLECTLTRSGSNLGLTARLVRLSDNRELWSATLDRHPKDILILQDNVVSAVLQALPVTTAPPVLSTLRYPRSIEAHALILRARYLKSKVTKESMERAIALFYEAIEKQPDSAAAYSGIAQCYTALAFSGQVAPNEAIPKAISAAQTALVIDKSQAEAHAALAIINLIFLWDWPGAEREFIESLRLNPDLVEGHHWYSHYLIVKGEFDRSLEESMHAQQLDPLDLLASAHLGWHYWYAGQFDRALKALNNSVELESNQFWAWRYLRWVREQREEFDKAVDAVQQGGALRNRWRTCAATWSISGLLVTGGLNWKNLLSDQPINMFQRIRLPRSMPGWDKRIRFLSGSTAAISRETALSSIFDTNPPSPNFIKIPASWNLSIV
jgi:TolB-like protein/Tfp pilus assembly protein PilF